MFDLFGPSAHLTGFPLANTSDLSDLLSSGRDRKEEEVALIEECEIKELIFRAERCFFLAKSYSSAGKRTEAYSLFSFARSLAENALKKLRSATSRDQVTIKELETLHNNCRSNSCIEHAMGIMEHEKAPEDLSKKISTVSISGTDRKVSIRKKHTLTTKQLLHIVKYCIMPT
ncbi:putative signal recognition particle subunit SRP68 [Helianthus annuus]|nr:putative signal recognition particle subunit SRP68 [Helianthus annuus]